MQNLHRRGKSGVYYARIFVPLDLQPAMGKDELRPSLRTTDLAEAKRRRDALLDQWSATFDDMRRRQTLTDDDIQTAVWDHYNAGLAAGDAERLDRPTEAAIEAATDAALVAQGKWDGVIASINAMTEVEVLAGRAKWAARRRIARLARLRADLGSGDTRLIEPEADAFLAKHKFRIARGDPRYRELCQKLMRAEIEQLERYAERDAGNFGGKPKDEIVHPPATRTDEPTDAADTIMAMFARYERENPNDIQPDSMRQARRDVQNFADFAGTRTRVRKISKALVRDWKDILADYPVKATETTIFKGKSPREIVAANKALPSPKPTLTRQTVRRYMASLGGFCRWLVKHDYLDANPVADMLPKKTGPTNKRDIFKDPALKPSSSRRSSPAHSGPNGATCTSPATSPCGITATGYRG